MKGMIIKVCCLLLLIHLSSAKWTPQRRMNIFARHQHQIGDPRCRQFRTCTQKVDHFGFSNMDTFEQRYTLNMDSWKSGAPIFFYAGNEGLIERILSQI